MGGRRTEPTRLGGRPGRPGPLDLFCLMLRVDLDWFSMVIGWNSVLPMVVAVAARGLGLVLRAAGLGVRVAGLGAHVAKDLFDWGARGLGLVFHVAGLGRDVDDARCCCRCARDWLSVPCCWAGWSCRWAGRPRCQTSFRLVLRVGLDWFSMLLCWVAVIVMLVAVAACGLGLVFRAAGPGVRVAGLGARVAQVFFDWGARGLGLVFHGAGLCRCVVGARGCWCTRVKLSFPCCWVGWSCRCAGRSTLPNTFLTNVARGLGLVFHDAGLGRCAVDARGCCCARAWLGFPWCWSVFSCRSAGRSRCQRSF